MVEEQHAEKHRYRTIAFHSRRLLKRLLMVKGMSEYPPGSREDRKTVAEMPMEKLFDYFFLQIRNIWRVDGLYFLGIEKKSGTEAATEIDAQVWESMAAIEAKSLQRMLKVGENPDVPMIVGLLRRSSWALDQPFKTIEISFKQAILSIDGCRTPARGKCLLRTISVMNARICLKRRISSAL